MNFVFESIGNGVYRNFINCTDTNTSGILRFPPSPVITELVKQIRSKLEITFTNKIPKKKNYIIATGVAHSPDFWTGKFDKTPSKKTIFDLLNSNYKKDIIEKKAFLLLDQTHEGYHEVWLWEWFHNECSRHGIPPTQIIYITGNLKSNDQYAEWTTKNKITQKLKIIPYAHFESAMAKMTDNINNSIADQLLYKKKNKDSIKLYNCLQKRPRNHRAWLFKELHEHGLLIHGINSMNKFDINKSYMDHKHISESEYETLISLLPMLPPSDTSTVDEFSSEDSGSYLTNFNEDITLDSWVSVVSEASFSDNLNTCFLSEKTFKPIACNHPFIIYGDKDSLHFLRSLGYKTFHPYINESYDSLSTWDRLDAIVNELMRIKNMSHEEKYSFYNQIVPILIYNNNILKNKKHNVLSLIKNIIFYTKEKEDNV